MEYFKPNYPSKKSILENHNPWGPTIVWIRQGKTLYLNNKYSNIFYSNTVSLSALEIFHKPYITPKFRSPLYGF